MAKDYFIKHEKEETKELTAEQIHETLAYMTNNGMIKEKFPERKELIGKVVQHKKSGDIGKVTFSSFGISIAGVNDDGSHWQTLGDDPKSVMEQWEVIGDGN